MKLFSGLLTWLLLTGILTSLSFAESPAARPGIIVTPMAGLEEGLF